MTTWSYRPVMGLPLAMALVSLSAMVGCAPTIQGHLRGATGEIVSSPQARVNVVSLGASSGDGAEPRTLILEVDGGGGFATREELPPGEYLVEALVPGYVLTSRRIRLGEDDTIDLTLAKTAATKTEAVRANTTLDAGRGGGGASLTPPSL